MSKLVEHVTSHDKATGAERWQGKLHERLNYPLMNISLISLFAHIGFLGFVGLYPHDLRAFGEELLGTPNRFAQLLLVPRKEDPYNRMARLIMPAAGRKAEPGPRARQELAVTRKGSATRAPGNGVRNPVEDALRRIFGDAQEGDPVMKPGLDRELVEAMARVNGAAVASVGLGDGLGGLRGEGGTGLGETYGIGAIHTPGGRSSGGAGTGFGSGTICPPSGSKIVLRDPARRRLCAKQEREIEVSQREMVVAEGLPREVVRRVIQQNRAHARYCYEKTLQSNPDLHGKVVVRFTIDAGGKVVSSSVLEQTLDDRAVASCLASKIKSWRFPKPRGGGVVVVQYPFVFKSGR